MIAPPKLSHAEISEIRRQRAAGTKVRVLARRFGVSVSYVSKVCTGTRRASDDGPLTRARVYTSRPNQDDPARRGLMTLEEIADRLGVSRGTAWHLHNTALSKLRAALVSMEAWQ